MKNDIRISNSLIVRLFRNLKKSKIYLPLTLIFLLACNSEGRKINSPIQPKSLSLPVYHSKKEIDLSKLYWSNRQGVLDWYTAVKRCREINMRLPTGEELQVLYESLTGWKNYGCDTECIYWSQSESNPTHAIAISMKNGKSYTSEKEKSKHDVRCMR